MARLSTPFKTLLRHTNNRVSNHLNAVPDWIKESVITASGDFFDGEDSLGKSKEIKAGGLLHLQVVNGWLNANTPAPKRFPEAYSDLLDNTSAFMNSDYEKWEAKQAPKL
jgi:hypothetical protein